MSVKLKTTTSATPTVVARPRAIASVGAMSSSQRLKANELNEPQGRADSAPRGRAEKLSIDLFAKANESTDKLFAKANESTDKLFAKANKGAQFSQANSAAPTTYARMGKLLGTAISSESDLVRIVNMGLPSAALDCLSESIQLDPALIGSESTVRRRKMEQQPFSVEESERLVRIARTTAMALELFGETQAASAWLSNRVDYLSDARPISPIALSATDAGARFVESMMLRTAHGIF
jgi:putative toxin-antitoxin system antitoxin component (TIGR02293 family)